MNLSNALTPPGKGVVRWILLPTLDTAPGTNTNQKAIQASSTILSVLCYLLQLGPLRPLRPRSDSFEGVGFVVPSYQLPTGVRLAVSKNKLVSVFFIRKPAGGVDPGLERLWLGLLVLLWQAPETRQLLKGEDLGGGTGEKRDTCT